jgi:hypothetical protein
MAKINLLKNEWVGRRQIKKLRWVGRVMAIITLGGFLIQVLYVTGRLVYLRTRVSKVKGEIGLMDNRIRSKKDLVDNYVWAQGVVSKLEEERTREYKYKDYLMEINEWLVEGTSLVGANFVEKNEIVFMVFAKDVDDYRRFETELRLRQEQEDFSFKKVEQEALNRLEDGTYKVKIRLEI